MTRFPLAADMPGRQAAFNVSSRDQWAGFAGHRERVMRILAAEARPGRSRLCVVGAGNSNDLDLGTLKEQFREIHLIDLDGEALRQGVARQHATDVQLHGGVDLTGLLGEIATWTPFTSIERPHLDALADWPVTRTARTLPGGFDVVISTCLLTQLMETATHALGPKHPRLPDVTRAVGVGHLRLIAELTAPGGAAIVVTEVTSSDTLPELGKYADSDLESVLIRVEQARNVFRGVDRPALAATIRDDPPLRRRVGRVETAGVWRWRLHEKDYLAYALRLAIGGEPRGKGP